MEASRGPPRVKNKAPGKSCLPILMGHVLTLVKLLSRSVPNSFCAKLSIDKSQAYKRLRSDSQISKSFMSLKAGNGRSSRTMCEGIG